VTLVPALCGLAGRRLMPRAERRGATKQSGPSVTARWADKVGRRPLAWAMAAALVMLTLAAPTLTMRTWPQDASTQSQDATTRQAYDLVAEEFGAGANASYLVVAERSKLSNSELNRLTTEVVDFPGVSSVGPVQPSANGALATFEIQPDFGPADERTGDLVSALREDVLPEGAELTGQTPFFSDIADLLADRLWLVIGFVVAVSVVLLAMMFRSVVVPIKAALMNVLSIGAAYGVVTVVFQWGWGAELLGLDHSVPVSSWLPILMFAILFGLSMDYEVFLLSRIREDWQATGDARASVVRGLASTGRVISAAAAIMVAVFLGFATEADVVVKMLGFGMAVAIFLDATVVRMVLVPATMALLGNRNWWLPTWLDRILPTVQAELGNDELVPVTETVEQPSADADDRVPVGV
jgi:RND superfamily putative drug exporter